MACQVATEQAIAHGYAEELPEIQYLLILPYAAS
jgi:hypothetical protein